MDKTKTYIKMSKQAEKIQALCPDDEHEWYACSKCGEIYQEDGGAYFSYCAHMSKIWLPRQDELQKILEDKKFLGDFWITGILNDFSHWAWNGAVDHLCGTNLELPSMEQLWLAFVMWQKYGKIWSAEKETWASEREDT